MTKKNPDDATPQAAVDVTPKGEHGLMRPPQEARDERDGVYLALLRAQRGIENVGKGGTNAFHKYKYTTAEDMIAASRLVLHQNGLLVFRQSWSISHGELEHDEATVTMSFKVMHPSSGTFFSADGEWFVVPEKGRPFDKAQAASLTTAFSYFLRDLLLLPRVDEDEVDKRDDRSYSPPMDAARTFMLNSVIAPYKARYKALFPTHKAEQFLAFWKAMTKSATYDTDPRAQELVNAAIKKVEDTRLSHQGGDHGLDPGDIQSAQESFPDKHSNP